MCCKSGNCVHAGCLFCYDGCTTSKCVCGSIGSSDCCCVRQSHCCACNARPRTCCCSHDLDGRGELCMVGILCCEFGLIVPSKFCAGAHQTCCWYSAYSAPWSTHYVGTPILALCCVQCVPSCEICAEPPSCPALDHIRDDHDPDYHPVEVQVIEDRGVVPTYGAVVR